MNEVTWCQHLADLVREKYSQEVAKEQRLWDGTRVDLLTDDWAIEVDWAHKWAEAVGQATYYAIATSRSPGIVLLVPDMEADQRHVYRCMLACERADIFLWLVDTKTCEAIDKDGNRHKIIMVDGNANGRPDPS